MCTMTLVATADRLRVMFNRDERHTRPEAWHPRMVRTAGPIALMPIDPTGGGTWIAASGAGLVFGLLNADGPVPIAAPSRGAIIPALARCHTLDQVVDTAQALCDRDWPAHRLFVANRRRGVELRLRTRGLRVTPFALDQPVMVTSSSADAEAVVPARRALFDCVFSDATDRLAAQDAFHRHRWVDRPQASVQMRRHDAATHSITTIDVSSSGVAMRYEPLRALAGRPAWISVPRGLPAVDLPNAGDRLARVS